MNVSCGLKSKHHWKLGVAVILFAAACVSSANAACLEPHARVCAEFFRKDAVFVGKVVSVRSLPASGVPDEWIYRLKVQKVFRGQVPNVTEVHTENASARFPLAVGATYLLFARKEQGHLRITSCGNSSVIADAKQALADLKTVVSGTRSGGTIEGQVVMQSDRNPVEGIRVSALGANQTFQGVTGADGWFHIAVPSGQYRVEVVSDRWNITAFDLSWDKPEKVEIKDRQCGLIQFIAIQK